MPHFFECHRQRKMKLMSMKMLFVKVSPAVLRALVHRADVQRRRPQDEAALIIERELGFASDLPPDQPGISGDECRPTEMPLLKDSAEGGKE